MASVEDLPSGPHNFLITFLVFLIFLWYIQVFVSIWKTQSLLHQLKDGRALLLEGMAMYANDFQRLIRTHFNQVLRIRRTVPAVAVPCTASTISLNPSSLAIDSKNGSIKLSFKFDASAPGTLHLYWGVHVDSINKIITSNDNREFHVVNFSILSFIRQFVRPESARQWAGNSVAPSHNGGWLEMGGIDRQFYSKMTEFEFKEGINQTFILPEIETIDIGAIMSNIGVVPLVVVLHSPHQRHLGMQAGIPIRTGCSELAAFKLRKVADVDEFTAEVVKLILFINGQPPQEVQDIYGLEDDTDPDCLICMSRHRDTLLLPCRHCCLCHFCLKNLDKCPICRSLFSSFMTFPIAPNQDSKENQQTGHTSFTEDAPRYDTEINESFNPTSSPSDVPGGERRKSRRSPPHPGGLLSSEDVSKPLLPDD
eukprot:GHVL01009409.1.p1 GENE.GHVL01009409.1~~GHVL01009409.1.p1  ORF type:complete len:424 (-),score=61.42 GHVL01009409.1:111-1382(-)